MVESHYFIAVPIPENIRKVLASRADGLRRKLKFRYWTGEEDYHITLFFMGASTQEQADDVKRGLQELVRRERDFFLEVNGIDGFGQKNCPRVVFAGLSSSEALQRLKKKVDQVVRGAGYRLEKRPYHPHITLAKKWSGGALAEASEYFEMDKAGLIRWRVDQIILFKVAPQMTPRYVPVETFRFGSE